MVQTQGRNSATSSAWIPIQGRIPGARPRGATARLTIQATFCTSTSDHPDGWV